MEIKYDKLKKVIDEMTNKHHTLSTMESCTGGGLCSVITNVEGANNVLNFSCITYSNEYKIKMGVDHKIIEKFGAYSIETSKAMSKAIAKLTNSEIGIGISGKLNSFDTIDEKNGMIYFSIYKQNEKKFYSKVVTISKPKREDSKKA